MGNQMSDLKQRESYRRYAERRGVTTKTLDRWVDAGILPEPDRINKRKYFDPNTEPRRDRDDTTKTAT
jgi:DNA-binding transcriptional MerR regulator